MEQNKFDKVKVPGVLRGQYIYHHLTYMHRENFKSGYFMKANAANQFS